MNRALPFLLLVAVIAGGLGFFALGTGPPVPPDSADGLVESDTDTAVAPRTAEDTSAERELASVPRESASSALPGGGAARSWEVIPMNQVGQIVAEAQITATQGTEVRTGEGRTKWTSVPSGAWTLAIESEGNPTWRREVVLAADEARRDSARLGEEMRVEGIVMDTAGEPLQRASVFLLPPGVDHPGRSDMGRSADQPRGSMQASNGAITAEVTPGGRFRARLPKDGAWRVSVGVPGDARWTQPKPTLLTYGGPDRATVTVPAHARLQVEFRGPAEERPTQVSAYVFDAEQARVLANARADRASGKGQSIEEAQRAAKERMLDEAGEGKSKESDAGGDGSKARSGTARPLRDEARESITEISEGETYSSDAGDRSAPLFEPGWRMIRSARIDDGGKALLTDLPGSESLRFLFVRDKERIVTASAHSIREGELNVGRVSLPPPGTSPPDGPDARASIQIGLGADAQAVERSPGVVWGY